MSTPLPPRRTRRPAAERRAEFAAAAEAIAREEGLAAVTLRAVADRVGVAPALVAHHAAGMDELVAEAFERVVGRELEDIRVLAAEPGGARRRLRAVLSTLLDGSRDDVTLVWVQAWALGARNPALAAAVRRQMDAWQEAVVTVLAEGIGAGEFAAADPRPLARQILGMVDGLNAHALVAWGDGDERREALHGAVEVILRLPQGGLAEAD